LAASPTDGCPQSEIPTPENLEARLRELRNKEAQLQAELGKLREEIVVLEKRKVELEIDRLQAEGTPVEVVLKSGRVMFSEPSLVSSTLGNVPAGERVPIFEYGKDDFWRIVYRGQPGYIGHLDINDSDPKVKTLLAALRDAAEKRDRAEKEKMEAARAAEREKARLQAEQREDERREARLQEEAAAEAAKKTRTARTAATSMEARSPVEDPAQEKAARPVRSASVAGFTIREYSIYRAVIDTPMSVSEEEALRRVAKRHGITVAEAGKVVDKVMEVLSDNGWFGTPESEIRHASDWKGASTGALTKTPQGGSVNPLLLIGLKLTPNKLGIRESDLQTMPNPKGAGTFVFSPKTQFFGVERLILWLVLDGKAYALNGTTKGLTPELPYPRDADGSAWAKTGLAQNDPSEALRIVFGK
jgi:hypothetical protein